MQLLVATQNKGKQQEISELLALEDLELLFPQQVAAVVDLDVHENGTTFAENAELKARAFALRSGLLTVAEDSGLQVEALQGEPGVASKRWHEVSDTDRNMALLERLQKEQNRTAKFVTTACIFDPETNMSRLFVGEMNGAISLQMAGSAGFGYDPIFVPSGDTKSLAELGVLVKNNISHRAVAFMKVRTYLETIV
ncbi:MAG: RdgB/HAM1 family non-canonical purine NTP pyrophosphatase [Candidatus Pacebacteria bacterium]|nr:RdgB/HAM1 family non-canonical purine NTP pyrophosphatase [Candidatus Paceibacterota bacterium]